MGQNESESNGIEVLLHISQTPRQEPHQMKFNGKPRTVDK